MLSNLFTKWRKADFQIWNFICVFIGYAFACLKLHMLLYTLTHFLSLSAHLSCLSLILAAFQPVELLILVYIVWFRTRLVFARLEPEPQKEAWRLTDDENKSQIGLAIDHAHKRVGLRYLVSELRSLAAHRYSAWPPSPNTALCLSSGLICNLVVPLRWRAF